jgi:hypothetical protein
MELFVMLLMARNVLSILFYVALLGPASAAGHGHARQVSARTTFNINTPGQYDYAFINFLQEGDNQVSPVGSSWSASGTCFWNSAGLDSNGWPNQACANGLQFGGGIRYPSSAQFSGQYTVDGSGLGVFTVGIGGTFTLSSGVQCGGVASGTAPNTTGSGWGYSSASGGTITTNDTSGTGFCVPFTDVGEPAPRLGNFNVNNTCSTTAGACAGAFIKNVRLYQQRDFTRLNAGNIFRSEYLQPIANLDPSYIRFMDWGPGDAYSLQIRYENRPKVTTSGLITGSYWLSSPPYTVSTGTNLVAVAAAAGTPGSMVHGEVATFKFGNAMNTGNRVFVQNGTQIAAITNASPGQVTLTTGAASATVSAGGTGFGATVTGTIQWSGSGCTFNGNTDDPVLNVTTNGSGVITTVNSVANPGTCFPLPAVATTWTAVPMGGLSSGSGASFTLTPQPNPFSTGDVVIHTMTATNMPDLNHYPVCVTVVDAIHYTMQVFTVATNTCTATPVNTAGFGSFTATGFNYAVEYISLNVGARINAPISDADGLTPLLRFFTAGAGSYALNLTYDKNSCAITDGSGNPICGAWLVNHVVGLAGGAGGQGGNPQLAPVEIEVEFINEVNALLTGGQHLVGLWINLPHMGLLPTDPDYTSASDYPQGMAKTIVNGMYPLCAGCPLVVENGNEWWNNFYPTFTYYQRQGDLRYGAGNQGSTDFGVVRTIQMFEDIHNNSGVYNPAVFHFAMMSAPPGQGGDPNGPPLNGNYKDIFGDATILGDARWPNPASKPYAYFDFGGWAPYVSASAVFYTANFTTMAANWCTAQATACAATPPFAPNCVGAVDTTYCAPFVYGGIGGPASVDLNTLTDLRNQDVMFANALYPVGKSYARYEGGAGWSTCSISDCGDNGTPNLAVPQKIQTAAQRNYMIALYQSQSWAQLWSSYCQGMMSDTSSGGCGNLSQITQPAVNFKFGYSSPDLFGSTTTEGNGLIPLWTSQAAINAGQP